MGVVRLDELLGQCRLLEVDVGGVVLGEDALIDGRPVEILTEQRRVEGGLGVKRLAAHVLQLLYQDRLL